MISVVNSLNFISSLSMSLISSPALVVRFGTIRVFVGINQLGQIRNLKSYININFCLCSPSTNINKQFLLSKKFYDHGWSDGSGLRTLQALAED